jgi:ubiquinone/menaquinone biosynthesis C-methylase UbiE
MTLGDEIGRRFARFATNVLVRAPRLSRLFRGPLALQFGRLATRWDSMRDAEHLASVEAALAEVDPPPGRALDLGTGTGAAAQAIAKRWAGTEVVGVDIARGMIEEARRKLPAELGSRVRFDVADAGHLPFADASFDLVVLANMIPFFDELARVVAPGGAVIFGFSGGSETPIYVPSDRLRTELQRRGFAHFADFSAARGTALLARKGNHP